MTPTAIPWMSSVILELENKGRPKSEKDSWVLFVNARLNLLVKKKINKGLSLITGSRITLTNNEIKDIKKAIKWIAATDAAIEKKVFWSEMITLINTVLLAKAKLNSIDVFEDLIDLMMKFFKWKMC